MDEARFKRFMDELTHLSLREVSQLKRSLDDVAVALVLERRRDGATWAQIADELGVTKQEAHRRYSVLARTAQERRELLPRFADDF